MEKDINKQLDKFISTNFQQIKWNKNDEVIVGIPSKQAEITVRMDEGMDRKMRQAF